MRITYSVPRHKRKKKIFKLSKGYYGDKGHRLRQAIQQVKKSLTTAYEHRKDKKGDLRQIWITRINAAAREEAEKIRALVEARLDCVETIFAELSPALGVHTGPGTAGLCYYPVISPQSV